MNPTAMLLLAKNVLFTIVVPGTVAWFLPHWLFGPYSLARSVPALLTGAALVAAGIALYVACVWPFATVGAGTPAPIDAPVRLVIVGPYRIVRNPMYVAVLSVIAGQAIGFGSVSLARYGLAVALVFHLVVVGYEELALQRQFGTEYREYRKRVPRWFPRLRRPRDGSRSPA